MGIQRDNRSTARVRGVALFVVLDLAFLLGVAGHLAQGTATGSSDPAAGDPVRLLGTTLRQTSCPTAPQARGTGMTVVCPDWTAITSDAGVVEVVSLYGPGSSTVDEYGGALPQGLSWGESLDDAWAVLGRPSHITGAYGSPMLVYTFDGLPYGSLELRFDEHDLLIRVNALRLR